MFSERVRAEGRAKIGLSPSLAALRLHLSNSQTLLLLATGGRSPGPKEITTCPVW